MKTIRLYAVADRSLPFEGGVGRFVGRDKKGLVRLDGDEVPNNAYYQRALGRKDVRLETPKEADARQARAKQALADEEKALAEQLAKAKEKKAEAEAEAKKTAQADAEEVPS